MKKSNFIILLLSIVSGLIFGLGMCMCLLPEWNMFNAGVVFTIVGILLLVATFVIFRKQSGKGKMNFNLKIIAKVLYGVLASLVLGTGMCMVMVFDMMIWGIIIGIVGLIMLLCLIPLCIGLKEDTIVEDKGEKENE